MKMLPWSYLAGLVLAPALARGLPSAQKRDLGFNDVPSTLPFDHSGRWGDPEEKYFHESSFHPHYDGRFAEAVLSSQYQRPNLTALIQSYLATMQSIGVETWLMHGSLLGWWWNRRALSWDTDADVMVAEHSMAYLARYYNVSMHRFEVPDTGERKTYLMEINPNWTNVSKADQENTIDARWIDTSNGLFIDITVIHPDLEHDPDGTKGRLTSKDKHIFAARDIFPLRDSVFEGRPAKVPYAYADLLMSEYGPASMTDDSFETYQFVWERGDWIRKRELAQERQRQPETDPETDQEDDQEDDQEEDEE